MPDEMRALTEELHAVNVMLGRVVDRLDQVDRVQRRHRFGAFVLAAVVAAVIGLGALGWVEMAEDDRLACELANDTRADIRAGIVETVLVIIESSGEPERLAPLVERITERLEVTIPDRACG